MRRNLKALQRAVAAARGNRERAAALYRLAVIHDNNGREAEAIPHYRRALALGLDRATSPRAMAWLASSLFKTNRAAAAMRWTRQALEGSCPPELRRFLLGLQGRISRERHYVAAQRSRK